MSPKQPNTRSQSWLWPVSALALAIGLAGSMLWVTGLTRNGLDEPSLDTQTRRGFNSIDNEREYAELSDEVTKLREEMTRMENTIAEGSEGAKQLNESLQSTKLYAGLTEVEGPGISVVLRDSERPAENIIDLSGSIIHDTDVLRIVNELWSAGAESISVNGLRVGLRSSFRCVGPTILVDSVRIASPVTIRVIGDPETLMGAMNLPGGPLDEIRAVDPAMVRIEIVESHVLPAFAGSTASKFAKPTKDRS